MFYLFKDQIFTWIAAESEIKSQIIWYKPSRRFGYADLLLRMHVRRRRKVGWLQFNWLSKSINRGMRCASVAPHTSRWDTQRDPTPKEREAATRGEAKGKIGPLSLLTPLSLFSLLLIWFVCYVITIVGGQE